MTMTTAQCRFVGLWLAFALVAALALGIWHRADVGASGSVSVYPGPERPGIDGRAACSFLDGIYNMRGEVVGQEVFVTDPLNREYYHSGRIAELDGYAIRQITCLRSAQTGYLVMTLGGFRAGGSTSQAVTLATDYYINQPVQYEDYLAGQR